MKILKFYKHSFTFSLRPSEGLPLLNTLYKLKRTDFSKTLLVLNLLFCSSLLFAQPANDNCSDATEITMAVDMASCNRTAGTTIGADPNDQANNPSSVCSGSWFRDDVWYKFNTGDVLPTASIVVDVEFNNQASAGIAFYPDGCGADAIYLNCLNTADGTLFIPSNSVNPNQDIWLRIWSTGDPTANAADFTICVYGSEDTFFPEENVIWGDNGEGSFTGGLNGWTLDNFTDMCGWEYWPNGTDPRGAWGDAFLFSPSSGTGTAVFNSDFLDNGGSQLPEDAGRGSCPTSSASPHTGSLVSPVIDLTGDEQSFLAILFYHSYRHNRSTTFVEYSFDNGTTWTGRQINTEIAENTGSVASGRTRFNLPFSDTQGQSSMQIRFRFAANYYFWIVDDVQIVAGECVDLIAPANDYYAIAPNWQTPVSQVQEIAFLNDIANVGACDLDDVTLTATVSDDNGIIYSDTKNYGTVAAGTDVQNQPFASLYTMPDVEGEYTGMYSISNGMADSDSTNNAQSFMFQVSDTVFSKERAGNAIFSNLARSNWDPAEITSWGFGNHFYVPNGGAFEMSSLAIGLVGDGDSQGAIYDIFLYKITDDGDGTFQDSEREIIGSSAIELVGDEGFIISEIALEAEDGSEKILLEDDTHYMAWVQHADSDTELAIGLIFDDEFGYGAMDLAFDSIPGTTENPNQNRYASYSIVDSNLDGPMTAHSTDIFGAPIIRMNISELISATTDPLSEENKISVFPNPTASHINLKLELAQNEDYARVNIVDVTGRIIQTHELQNVQAQTESYDVSNLPSGAYLIQYISETGTRTMKFTKH